jgi:thioredoxin-dependent peroxiredoxin
MRRSYTVRLAIAAALASAFFPSASRAQQPSAPATPAPEVGTMAPDFGLPAATRYGTLREPVRLSDLRGKTVVLAFFYKARTKG